MVKHFLILTSAFLITACHDSQEEGIQRAETQLNKAHADTEAFISNLKAENEKMEKKNKALKDEIEETDRKNDELRKWKYSKTSDKINGGTIKTAQVISEKTLNFSSPYTNGSGVLLVRKRSIDGLNIMFSITNGQIICRSSCSIKVRFDEKPPMRFQGQQPSDYRNTTIFISPESKFLKELMNSKKALVEVTYYQAGNQVAEFNTSGFEWH